MSIVFCEFLYNGGFVGGW